MTPKDIAKAEIFYGHDLEDKKNIFNSVLENEEFVDRRIFRSEILDPETESDIAEDDFFDKYDENGVQIHEKPQYLSSNTKYPFQMT